MTTLDPQRDHVVLINTFIVKPGQAEALLDLLAQATEQVMKRVPGFISANLHISDDRKRVVNYAQWESREAFAALREFPGAGDHMGKAAAMAESFEPVLYTLRFVEGPA